MAFLDILDICNDAFVLIFGLFLSFGIACGWDNRREKRIVLILCPVLLLIQGLFWLLWGTQTVQKLYPLIAHLPLVLVLVFALKQKLRVALVSVCIAYQCCQFPRWIMLAALAMSHQPLAAEICYTVSLVLVFLVLQRWFVRAAHAAIGSSEHAPLLFGSLPMAYYLFDYTTSVYADVLRLDVMAIHEFLPTALILFYVFFLTAYHTMSQKHAEAQLQSSMLEAELKQSQLEIESLQLAETQTAIYQHDIRHHMTMLGQMLMAGQSQQAEAYIRQVQADIEAITPHRYCENETVNLLCAAFADRAKKAGIDLQVEAKLPKELGLPDTELCSILSNGLENAIHGAESMEAPMRWVKLYCGVRLNKLLIEIRNPYAGEIVMQNGVPASGRDGHGYGCRSICSITERHHGLCTFTPDHGVFILQVALPVSAI